MTKKDYGNRASDHINHEGRIVSLETSLDQFQREMHRLVESTDQSFRDLFKKIDSIHDEAAANRPVDARYVTGFLTIGMFIISGFFSVVSYGYSKDIERMERNLVRERLERHEEITEIRRIQDKDHEITLAHILKGGHVGVQTSLEFLKSEVADGKRWRQEHDEKVGGINSSQDAHIDAIERKVFQDKN